MVEPTIWLVREVQPVEIRTPPMVVVTPGGSVLLNKGEITTANILPHRSRLCVLAASLIALSPTAVMIYFIYAEHNVFYAMICMHGLCMISLPLLYLICLSLFSSPTAEVHPSTRRISNHDGYFSTQIGGALSDEAAKYPDMSALEGRTNIPRYTFGERFQHGFEKTIYYYTRFWKTQYARINAQLVYGIFSGSVFAVSVFECYHIASFLPGLGQISDQMRANALLLGFDVSPWVLAAIGIYFILVNPILEENFWRCFLYRELAGRLFVRTTQPIFIRASEDEPVLYGTDNITPHESSNDPNNENNDAIDDDSSDCNGNKNYALSPDMEAGKIIAINHTCEEFFSEVSTDHHNASTSSTGDVPKKSPEPAKSDCFTQDGNNEDFNLANSYQDEYGKKYTTTGWRDRERLSLLPYTYFCDFYLSWKGYVLLSLFYSAYHAPVIYGLVGPVPAVIVTTCLVGFGCLTCHVRNHPSGGIFLCMFMHAGVDLGAVLAYVNVLAQLLPV